jgi:branched-chain amino acid transport system permease protein
LNSSKFDLHLGAALSIPIAIIICGVAAIVMGLPSLRVRGDYFALVSLAFAEIVRLAIINLDELTGGSAGLVDIDALHFLPNEVGPALDTSLERYVAGWILVGLIAFWLIGVRRRPLGRAWVAVREDEEAARATGVRPLAAKLSALLVAAALAAIAGCLFAASQLALSPSSFGLLPSFIVLAAIVLGGMGSTIGAILGTWVLLAIPEVVRDLGGGGDVLLDYRMLIYGGALLLVVLLRPGGLLAEARHDFGLRVVPTKGEIVPETRGAALEVRDVTARYGGVVALDAISMAVRPGEFVGIIGANGSGKTTLLNVLSGFHPVAVGSVWLDGRDITQLSPENRARAGIARTFQMNRLFEGISNAENVMVGAETALAVPGLTDLAIAPASARRARVFAWQSLMVFADRFPPVRWRQLPGNLSYANRRRLEMARARAVQPRLLLLDEPTAGMNPVDRDQLLSQARAWADQGCTVLLVEHQLAAIARVVDRLIALDHGVIIADAPPDEALSSTRVLEALTNLEPTVAVAQS